jgi:hypothetical protein
MLRRADSDLRKYVRHSVFESVINAVWSECAVRCHDPLATGQIGTFKVLKVYEQGSTADLSLIGAHFYLNAIRWRALWLLREAREDV